VTTDPSYLMFGENRVFKSGKTILLRWDFCWSRISAGFGKSARFLPEPEPKSSTALISTQFSWIPKK